MVRSGKLIWVIAGLLYASGAFTQTLWSEVQLDRSSVYVGEPVEVRIAVYTSTWFTSGLDLGNIKVEGAFTVYFRPVSTSVQKNGQTYAGVILIYHVFPFSEKDIVFPSLEIAVETPVEGDYKGKKQVVKSEEKPVRVKPIPAGFDPDQWLVTTDLSVSDNWQGDLQNVKVGDVLVRQTSRTAEGTVSELIPPIGWDSLAGVSLYQARSNVVNNQSRTAISAGRTETMRYLFEKEGEVVIPEMVFTWFDPAQQKPFKRTLKEVKIDVLPNPDLGVLESVKDSLAIFQAAAMNETSEDKPHQIFGLSPEKLAGFLLALIIIIYSFVILLKRSISGFKLKHERYLNSETYYFNKFRKDARKGNSIDALKLLYRWLDELDLHEPSLTYYAKTYGSRELQDEVLMIEKALLENRSKWNFNTKEWAKARRRAGHSAAPDTSSAQWINPG